MKKTIYLLCLALTALLTACNDEQLIAEFSPKDEDIAENTLFYRMYIEPYIGQWNLSSYWTLTRTNVLAADSTICDQIQGFNSQETKGTWTFQGDGWGTIKLQEGYSCPLLTNGNTYEFQWEPIEETGILHFTLYHTVDKTTSNISFDAIPDWPAYSNANSYDSDRFGFIIHYETNGTYSELEDIYPEYTLNNDRYDGTGCTFIQYVMLALNFERK